jgi:hypothetical protein
VIRLAPSPASTFAQGVARRQAQTLAGGGLVNRANRRHFGNHKTLERNSGPVLKEGRQTQRWAAHGQALSKRNRVR